MKNATLLGFAMTAALLLPSGDARPCGGPEFAYIDRAVQPVDELLAWSAVNACTPEERDSTCEFIDNLDTIFELRFLYPFHLAKPADYDGLFQWAYPVYDTEGRHIEAEPLRGDTLAQKVGAQDWDGAEKEARSLVDRILNMPLALANENSDLLGKAVAVLDLKPLSGSMPSNQLLEFWFRLGTFSYRPAFLKAPPLAGPLAEARKGTVGFITLKEAMRTQIPNGWIDEIRKNVTPEIWKGLADLHERWLKDFPNHPLADLVRLSQVRLAYLQGNSDEAWKMLFSLYRQRPVRAAGEMRFLLQQQLAPDPSSIPDDPVLLSALTPWIKFRDSAAWSPLWTKFWNVAVSNAKALWTVNFQERLLKRAADLASAGIPLPEGFPQTSQNLSPLWSKFRLFALYKSGQWDQAFAQAMALTPDGDTAPVIAKLYLRRKEWEKAVSVKALPFDSKRYLIRILFDDDALLSLQGLPDPKLKREVLMTLAMRAAAKGDWAAAAKIASETDPKKAGLWMQAIRLASDTSLAGELAFARFASKNDGKLFYPPDTVWYRSIFWRMNALKPPSADYAPTAMDPNLPWTRETESEAIIRHLSSLEPYLALKAYGAWLSKADGKDPQAKTVLKEADKTYNWLVNWANNYSDGWKAFLNDSSEAQTIRKVGMEIK